jgi:hypothetical protein
MELSQISIIFIGVFIVIWTLYYLFIILRAIALIGVRKYFFESVLRDCRLWEGLYNSLYLIVLFLIGPHMLNISISPTLKVLIAFVLLRSALKGFLPPQILLLHSFKTNNYSFARSLVNSRVGIVDSLAPGIEKPIHILKCLIKANWGFGTKVGSEKTWRRMVMNYIKIAEVIIMDISEVSKGLAEEMQILAKTKKHQRKLIFVYHGQEIDKSKFESVPDELKKELPGLPYNKSAESSGINLSRELKEQIFIKGKYLMPMWLKWTLGWLFLIDFLYELSRHA